MPASYFGRNHTPTREIMRILLAAFASFATASTLAAQNATPKPRPEIGFRAGFMHVSTSSDFGDESFTAISLPTTVPFTPGGIHFLFFPAPRFALEPMLSMVRLSDDDGSFMLSNIALQANGFLGPDATRAPYLFAQIATLREDEGDGSDSQTGFGAGIGYRRVIRESLALRYELRYRRWDLDGANSNEIGLLIGVGAVIR
jgi:hypothetical protein